MSRALFPREKLRFVGDSGLDDQKVFGQVERLQAEFIFRCAIGRTWAPVAVLWLRQLGGKLGLRSDRDGPYVLMGGMSAVWQTAAMPAFWANHPFPRAF